jgi:hypothetical protein
LDGHLAIPEALIKTLPRPAYRLRVRTASGETVRVPAYLGWVEFVEQPGAIYGYMISLGDEYMIGLEMLNHFRVTFDHGERVTIEP